MRPASRTLMRLRFGLLTVAGATAVFWWTRPAPRAEEGKQGLEARPSTPPPPPLAPWGVVSSAGSRSATSEPAPDRSALRRAIARRDHLEAQLEDLEVLRRVMELEATGESLPPTIPNCAHAAGVLAGCPMPSESPEYLRFLADCDILKYDVPTSIFKASKPGVGPVWAELDLTEEQRQELAAADRHASERLSSSVKEAYEEAVGEELPAGVDLADALRQVMRTETGQASFWGAGEGARARLGELSEDEIAGLPPVARLYARVATAGDAYEQSLAAILGADQAHALREMQLGWDFHGVAGGNADPECSKVDLPEDVE